MASSNAIRARIGSVKSTRKITRAMEMIAASKMRKARQRMEMTKPYAKKAMDIVQHVALAHPEYLHMYLKKREVRRVGFLIIGTDRGLCGSLNTNLFKTALKSIRSFVDQGMAVDLALVGHRAEVFFKGISAVNVVACAHHLGDAPSLSQVIGVIKVMLDAYESQGIDQLFLVFNEFISAIKQAPTVLQLLPILPIEQPKQYWDYLYEPDAISVLSHLMQRYVDSQVYQGIVENIACEQAARMFAMQSATRNAGELMDDLKLIYNKARQASITKELAEIVSGASEEV